MTLPYESKLDEWQWLEDYFQYCYQNTMYPDEALKEVTQAINKLLEEACNEARVDELVELKRVGLTTITTNERSAVHVVPMITIEDRLAQLKSLTSEENTNG